MMRAVVRLRVAAGVAAAVLSASLGALSATMPDQDPPAADRPQRPSPPAAQPLAPLPPPAAEWKEVERLVGEDKVQAALEVGTRLRRAAQERGDEAEWARGLVREAQLTVALHGYVAAVRHLRATPWPQAPLPRAMLDLYYAHALVVYQRPNHLMSRAARERRVFFVEEPVYEAGADPALRTASREGVTVVTPVLPEGKIEVRSISRFGYKDLGNRQRVEALRQAFEAVPQPSSSTVMP